MRASPQSLMGGENAFVERWVELLKSASGSFRLKSFGAIIDMSLAVEQRKAAEVKLLVRDAESGKFTEEGIVEALERLDMDQLVDAACQSVGSLVRSDLLGEVLRRLRERGELQGEKLEGVRRAVG